MLKIRIKYLTDDMTPIKVIPNGDWIDLRTAKEIEVHTGDYTAIPLGVAMQLPEGYEALLVPRSSTFDKYGIIITNSIGIMDESFCGDEDEWKLLTYATRDAIIPKDERICQFRIIEHQPLLELEEVKVLNNPNRGATGSTDNLEDSLKNNK